MKDTRLIVLIEKKDKQTLERIATRKKVSLATVVREAIEAYLKK